MTSPKEIQTENWQLLQQIVRREMAFLWQYQVLIVSVVLMVVTVSVLYAIFQYRPHFASEATVVIKDSALTAEYLTNTPATTTTSKSTNPVLNTMELLKSDILAVMLWNKFIVQYPQERRRLKLETFADWKRYFGRGEKYIATKHVPGTDVIHLSFEWSDPELAQAGLSVVLEAFRNASRKLNQLEHHERYVYLSNQVQGVREQLLDVRNRMSDYKKTYGITDINEDLANYSKTRIDFERATREALADSARYKTLLSAYEDTIDMPLKEAVKAAALGKDPSLEKLYDEYYELSQEYASLNSRYTPEHKKMKDLSAKLRQVKHNIRSHIQRTAGLANAQLDSKSLSGADARISLDDATTVKIVSDETRSDSIKHMIEAKALSEGSEAKLSSMKAYLDELESKMADLSDVEEHLLNLQQEETMLSDSLDKLEQQVLEARIRETQTSSNVFVVNDPTFPQSSVFPSRVQLVLMGLLFGLLAGVLAAKIKARFWVEAGQGVSARDDMAFAH